MGTNDKMGLNDAILHSAASMQRSETPPFSTGYIVSPGGSIRKVTLQRVFHNGTAAIAELSDGKRHPLREIHLSRNFAIGYGNALIAKRVEALQAELQAIEEYRANLMRKD